MADRRPRSRERNNTGEGKGIFKRGATGNGPVGTGNAINTIKESVEKAQAGLQNKPVEKRVERPQENSRPFGVSGAERKTTDARFTGGGYPGGYGSNGSYRRSGGGLRTILLILLLAVIIYFVLKSMGFFSAPAPANPGANNPPASSGTTDSTDEQEENTESETPTVSGASAATVSALNAASGVSSGWTEASNDGIVSSAAVTSAREKFTTIKGDGTDQMTIFIYLCGTDLESKSAMATRDIQEMMSAKLSDNVKIVIMTGGCKNWQNDVMSSSVNEIYEISSRGLSRISNDAGTATMVDPENLEAFIKLIAQNYDTNRKALIFWDHGGGSVQGYGYDEKYPGKGSMTLDEINSALNNAGVKFDFIGFDACLMATAETALVCSEYADYMIASEEVEPGIGWYYTTWLNALSENPGIPTVELAKILIDDFTAQCARYCPGQETTLSIVDLAELSHTLPDKLAAFSNEVSAMIEDGRYKSIARARASSHEFAASNYIDQVDLVHFAALLGTPSGKELAQTVVDAVKYNRTAKGLNNAYGLSIYFPYRSVKNVDFMSSTYKSIGISDNYSSCIKKFAQMQVGGQAASGGSYDPFWTLLNGDGTGSWTSDYSGSSGSWGQSSGSGYGSDLTQQVMEELLTQLLGGRFTDFASLGMTDLNQENTRFLSETPIDVKSAASYIYENILDPEDFIWKKNSNNEYAIVLSPDKWELINRVDMAMFYDDGEGYLDLGLDNLYDFDTEGNLVPVLDHSWLSIDDQPVAYYHMATYDNSDDNYSIIGRVPVLLNGEKADLLIVFDAENPDGYVAGYRYGYAKDITEVLAKNVEELKEGDIIDFVCDYYAYDGTFRDSYMIGEQYTVTSQEDMTISNTNVGDDVFITYCFTDIYGEEYWTPTLR